MTFSIGYEKTAPPPRRGRSADGEVSEAHHPAVNKYRGQEKPVKEVDRAIPETGPNPNRTVALEAWSGAHRRAPKRHHGHRGRRHAGGCLAAIHAKKGQNTQKKRVGMPLARGEEDERSGDDDAGNLCCVWARSSLKSISGPLRTKSEKKAEERAEEKRNAEFVERSLIRGKLDFEARPGPAIACPMIHKDGRKDHKAEDGVFPRNQAGL
uniref:Uncharacterized protein n=1 Tax=Steinernema glaseri TaxID=37863 RepID=A0A1I7Y615_9BILA